MPDSKDISSYPEWFWGILKQFQDAPGTPPIQQFEVLMQDKGSAYTARRQFYSWRLLARAQNIPGIGVGMGLSLAVAPRAGGQWAIIFRKNAGISPESLAQLLPEVAGGRGQLEGPVERAPQTPALTQLAGDPGEDDATEELVGRLLGVGPRDDSPK